MDKFEETERTTLKRLPKRAVFDRETVYGILDEGLICRVGFVVEGRPIVLPTSYGRSGDTLYVHGSAASRMMRTLAGGVDVCIEVSLIDGLVLARSAFNHSMNYRSVVVFGVARPVESESEKVEALKVISDHLIPGRWEEVRGPSALELKATTVLRLELEEVSAKVRTGPPIDDDEDYALTVWAGVLPMRMVTEPPEIDPRIERNQAPPKYIAEYRRGRRR